MTRLADYDAEFDQERSEALKEGSVLRYVGVVDLEQGIVKADLQKYVLLLRFRTTPDGIFLSV